MSTYELMLDEAYQKVKQVKSSSERFEISKIEGHFEGKKTILSNFFQISTYLRREPEHFLKFMLKELAAAGQRDGERLILNIKVPSAKINQKIEEYAKEFVICRECGKPDTELMKEARINFIHCLACGAKHPIRGKI